MLIYPDEIADDEPAEEIPDYPVTLFFTRDGYFKKITPQSLRMSGEQKLKDGDAILREVETTNAAELLFFTNQCRVYKARACDFSDTKASVLGEYIPAKLQMEEGEQAVDMVVTKDYKGILLFAFENGKVAKLGLELYETKTNRKRLTSAYSDKSPLAGILYLPEDNQAVLTASSGRMLLIDTSALNVKSTRSTQGVSVMRLKKGQRVMKIEKYREGIFEKPSRYRSKTLPALGAFPAEEDSGEQLKLI